MDRVTSHRQQASPSSCTSCHPLRLPWWFLQTQTHQQSSIGRARERKMDAAPLSRQQQRPRQPSPIPPGSQCRGFPLAGALAPRRPHPGSGDGARRAPGGEPGAQRDPPRKGPSRNLSANCSSAEG